jgi:transcriptional regulator GlxA family with amidase domain
MDGMNEHTYRRMLRARTMLDHSHGAFDLPRLARDLHMTPGSLVRTFKQAFDESPYRYVRRRRVERAKALLEGTSEPATDIGFIVGFVDRASFDAAFSEFAGSSPEVYRRRAAQASPAPGRVSSPIADGAAAGVVYLTDPSVERPVRASDGAAQAWVRLLRGR